MFKELKKGLYLQRRWGLIFIGLTLLTLMLYWYEWRPVNIHKECWQYAQDHIEVPSGEGDIDKFVKAMDFVYKDCLRMRGLE